jgi:hypothetical protein
MTDQFTKFTLLRPLKSTTTDEVVRQIYDVTCTFGPPSSILTDGASYFKANQLKLFCQMTNITKLVANPYCPKTVGLVESKNKFLAQALSKYINPKQTDWPRFLPGIQFAYNTTICPSTGYTPYQLTFGRPCRSPLDFSLHVPAEPTCTVAQHASSIANELEFAYRIAQEQLRLTRSHMKKRYDELAHDMNYKVGDLVWILQSKKAGTQGQSKCLACPYYGPYYIVQILAQKNIKVRSMTHQSVPIIIHVDRLKPYIPAQKRPDPGPQLPWPGEEIPSQFIPKHQEQREAASKEPVEPASGDVIDVGDSTPRTSSPLNHDVDPDMSDVYAVDRIIKKRVRQGKIQFLVRWKGYSPSHDQWVDQEDILSDDLVRAFNQSPPRQQRRKGRRS